MSNEYNDSERAEMTNGAFSEKGDNSENDIVGEHFQRVGCPRFAESFSDTLFHWQGNRSFDDCVHLCTLIRMKSSYDTAKRTRFVIVSEPINEMTNGNIVLHVCQDTATRRKKWIPTMAAW